MSHTVDARGLACPQPVILAKKALERHEEVLVIVNDTAARENVKKLASSLGYAFTVEQQDEEARIAITKGETCALAEDIISTTGPVVVAVSSNTMGTGDDTLGGVLMKSFLHTLLDTTPRPDVMIFFNAGVKLTVEGSEVLDDLGALAEAGTKILVCGTCLNFFEIKDRLAAGSVSNMYDIARSMLTAGRLVRI
ncbi:MAG TPA: sulfurtransferase-like selenium metabolism protein YedF [Deltaproteobacteria bacterium]|nr:sulfurtransferase-like selenium metabolism protein YedF [Deltaproteobacteria bacterium]HPR54665.1 sulfurtransferase-like selenium metabolism protein YedF [Deltaproteobacteria bacterium]HXK46670.1 sulfurtransferase-like selenium metabolism protein YedF [Deltaproteobacteria bacterium]